MFSEGKTIVRWKGSSAENLWAVYVNTCKVFALSPSYLLNGNAVLTCSRSYLSKYLSVPNNSFRQP